ncbi:MULTISPECIES: fimbrial protein [unclassified Serratia (in: enterobacteria)]|uniref:fimbrial protein n=1 Tax=unclassified Serratia (in: enterobacteria) TaxID=2647522 RepID=UPI002ED10611|nr:fimbrial protein [Serratia sp. C2(2)]MEE4449983.1 fimbrial protein [Serratia sp. C2(1)]
MSKPSTTPRKARLRLGFVTGVILSLFCSVAYAFTLNVTVSGTVIDPPCVINGNTPINIDFGNDILIGRIDGNAYEQPILYTLDCSAATAQTLKLQLKGNGATFDPTVLRTSKDALGIELKSNGSKLAVNSWENFTDPARPTLSAVLVKNGGGTLTGGAFTATSTLLVDYQ